MTDVSVIIAAAGMATRMNGVNKTLLCINDVPVVIRSILAFERNTNVSQIIVVAKDTDADIIRTHIKSYNITKVTDIVHGGDTRGQSIQNGLDKVYDTCKYIAIHDGARPLVTDTDISNAIQNARLYKATSLGAYVKDTIKEVDNGFISKTIPRDNLVCVYTPQIFEYNIYKQATKLAKSQQKDFTDDCQILENAGHRVFITQGSSNNIKITTQDDVIIANAILGGQDKTMKIKIGHGYDVHKLVPNRDLILGGVNIPHTLGLLGHSDADVITHAVMDSLLGAAGLGDIGRHFPDTDPLYKGANSITLLSYVIEKITALGYTISNIDCTIIAQAPKLAPYIQTMRENIALTCNIDVSDVNVKATTEEKLGFTGRLEGISAHAVSLIVKI